MSDLSPSPSVSQADQRRGWKSLRESQLDILREGTFSDVTFIVGPSKERIPCLQIFLKSRSPVFQVMFSERWNHDKVIPLEDVDPKIFRKFLEFMYADAFEVTVPEALELLQVAHKYDVHVLLDKCEKLLESETTINDAVDVFQAARKYGKIQLMDKIGNLMSKSPSELQSFPSFSRLDKETLAFIVKRNDLKKIKEVELFCLALDWARNQPGLPVPESLDDILPHIRFPVMTLEEFTRTVLPIDILSETQAMKLFKYFGSDAGTKKSLADTFEFSTQRRRSPDSIVSLPIYSGNYEDKDTNLQMQTYDRLRECLQFYTSTNSAQSLCNPSDDGNETTVGLNGITLYCPAKERDPWGRTCAREFKIRLLTKYCCNGMEGGKVKEIEFQTVIPVRHRTLYCIIVEEKTRYPLVMVDGGFVNGGIRMYKKDFGPVSGSLDVNIHNECLATLIIKRNNLNGFGQSGQRARPRFICKLGFEEL